MPVIRIPATAANLGPGFDCLGLALTCYNTVEFEFTGDGLTIELAEKDRKFIPADARNLIYRVFAATLRDRGAEPPGVRIREVNSIPSTHGLGSSSACVVAGVAMANYALGGGMRPQEMLDLCANREGHPDNVLPAFWGGFTVGALEDGHVRYEHFDPPKNLRCAVFVPEFSLPTRKARAVLPYKVPRADAVFNVSRAALLTAAFAKGDLELLSYALRDRLHEPYRKSLIPHFDDVVRIATEHGALGACLSGAGPTVIAFLDGKEGFAEEVREELAVFPGKWDVRELEIDRKGYSFSE